MRTEFWLVVSAPLCAQARGMRPRLLRPGRWSTRIWSRNGRGVTGQGARPGYVPVVYGYGVDVSAV